MKNCRRLVEKSKQAIVRAKNGTRTIPKLYNSCQRRRGIAEAGAEKMSFMDR